MRVLTKEHHDEMPLKRKQLSESIRAINYKHHHQCFHNVYTQTMQRSHLTFLSDCKPGPETSNEAPVSVSYLWAVVPGQKLIVVFFFSLLKDKVFWSNVPTELRQTKQCFKWLEKPDLISFDQFYKYSLAFNYNYILSIFFYGLSYWHLFIVILTMSLENGRG